MLVSKMRGNQLRGVSGKSLYSFLKKKIFIFKEKGYRAKPVTFEMMRSEQENCFVIVVLL